MDQPALVRKLHDEGRYKEALRAAKHVLKIHPGDPETLFWASSCHSVLGHRRDALRFAKRALAAAPFDISRHVWLAEVHAWRGERRPAMRALEEALALKPDSLFAHRRRAAVLLKLGLNGEAADAARTALRLAPHDREALDLLARALTHLGRRDDAAGVTRGVLAQDPEHPQAHARLGWIGLSGGSGGDAVAHFREALRLDPTDKRAQVGLLHALRARFFLYGWLLRLFLWVGSRPPKVRLAMLLGGFLGFLLVGTLAEGTRVGKAAMILGYSWILLLAAGPWLIQPLADLILRFDPQAARVMKRRDIIRADILAAIMLFCLMPWVPILDAVIGILLLLGIYASSIWHAVTWPNASSRRKVRWGAAILLSAPALWLAVTLVVSPRLAPLSIAFLAIDWFLFLTWAARLARRDGI